MQIELTKIQDFLEWFKTKLYLDSISQFANRRYVKRGQVYNCYLGIGIGSEIQKLRPCIIVQNNIGNSKSGNVIIVPITHTNKDIPSVVPIQVQYNIDGTIILDGYANTSNVLCVSKARLKEQLGILTIADMKVIDKALASSLDLLHYYAKKENNLNDKLKYIEKIKIQRNNAEDNIKELLILSGCENITDLKEFLKTTRQ